MIPMTALLSLFSDRTCISLPISFYLYIYPYLYHLRKVESLPYGGRGGVVEPVAGSD